MTQRVTSLESILRRDRGVVLAGVVGVAAVAWGYTVYLAWGMGGGMAMGTSLAMPQTAAWGAVDFALMFVMWAVMMVAMMVPTAAPMILVFAKVNRTRRDQQRPFIPTGVFLSGYVIIWSGFALLATVVWLLWVIGRSAGPEGTTAILALLVGVGLMLWIYGAFQAAGRARASLISGLAAAAVVVAGLAALPLERPETALASVEANGRWQAFDPAAIEADLGRGRPVFVYFTADWCLTCKVNEKLVLSDDEVRG